MLMEIAPNTAHVWQVTIDDMQAQRPLLFSLLDADERGGRSASITRATRPHTSPCAGCCACCSALT